jgi:predicted nucleic acid-binding Zn ribbon protein
MQDYSYDRTAATRRTRRTDLEEALAEAKFKITYIKTLDRPAEVEARAIKRWQAEIEKIERALSRLPVAKPKTVRFEFTNQPAAEDSECLECGKAIDEGSREWWEVSDPEGAFGPFCTRRCAQLMSATRRRAEGDGL